MAPRSAWRRGRRRKALLEKLMLSVPVRAGGLVLGVGLAELIVAIHHPDAAAPRRVAAGADPVRLVAGSSPLARGGGRACCRCSWPPHQPRAAGTPPRNCEPAEAT